MVTLIAIPLIPSHRNSYFGHLWRATRQTDYTVRELLIKARTLSVRFRRVPQIPAICGPYSNRSLEVEHCLTDAWKTQRAAPSGNLFFRRSFTADHILQWFVFTMMLTNLFDMHEHKAISKSGKLTAADRVRRRRKAAASSVVRRTRNQLILHASVTICFFGHIMPCACGVRAACDRFGLARNTAATFDLSHWLQVTNFDVLFHSAPNGANQWIHVFVTFFFPLSCFRELAGPQRGRKTILGENGAFRLIRIRLTRSLDKISIGRQVRFADSANLPFQFRRTSQCLIGLQNEMLPSRSAPAVQIVRPWGSPR